MPAFSTIKLSPLHLELDLKNPRFILPMDGAKEEDVFIHLLKNERVDVLCNRLNTMGTILPGERIVACIEDKRYIVLEGNRRICCCKMLLDRSLIPADYSTRIKQTTELAKQNLAEIEVDIVPSREEAKKYLAARHINGVQDWSPIAKMNFVVEEFYNGRSVEEIIDITSLSSSNIRRFLRESNLLKYGISSGNWNIAEQKVLHMTNIEPTKYTRLFGGSGINRYLGIYFDGSFVPHSSVVTDEGLYTILALLVRKTFIESEFDTRVDKAKIEDLLAPLVSQYKKAVPEKEQKSQEDDTQGDQTSGDNSEDNSGYKSAETREDPDSGNTTGGKRPGGEPKPRAPRSAPLFGALDCENIDRSTDPNYRGLIHVAGEVIKFSNTMSNPRNYPIASVLLTRSLLEQVIVAFLKKKGDWSILLNTGTETSVKLSSMIKYCVKRNTDYFKDPDVRSRFMSMFEKYETGDKLNWVVHQLNSYKMSTETLQAIVDEGLFDIIQYMIKQL